MEDKTGQQLIEELFAAGEYPPRKLMEEIIARAEETVPLLVDQRGRLGPYPCHTPAGRDEG